MYNDLPPIVAINSTPPQDSLLLFLAHKAGFKQEDGALPPDQCNGIIFYFDEKVYVYRDDVQIYKRPILGQTDLVKRFRKMIDKANPQPKLLEVELNLCERFIYGKVISMPEKRRNNLFIRSDDQKYLINSISYPKIENDGYQLYLCGTDTELDNAPLYYKYNSVIKAKEAFDTFKALIELLNKRIKNPCPCKELESVIINNDTDTVVFVEKNGGISTHIVCKQELVSQVLNYLDTYNGHGDRVLVVDTKRNVLSIGCKSVTKDELIDVSKMFKEN